MTHGTNELQIEAGTNIFVQEGWRGIVAAFLPGTLCAQDGSRKTWPINTADDLGALFPLGRAAIPLTLVKVG